MILYDRSINCEKSIDRSILLHNFLECVIWRKDAIGNNILNIFKSQSIKVFEVKKKEILANKKKLKLSDPLTHYHDIQNQTISGIFS